MAPGFLSVAGKTKNKPKKKKILASTQNTFSFPSVLNQQASDSWLLSLLGLGVVGPVRLSFFPSLPNKGTGGVGFHLVSTDFQVGPDDVVNEFLT